MGEIRYAYSILFGKLERNKPLVRPRNRWEYNIRMDIREVGLEVVPGYICLRIETDGGFL
jgi:hypothetical protein